MNKIKTGFIKRIVAMTLVSVMAIGSLPHIVLADTYGPHMSTDENLQFTTYDVLELEPFVYVTGDGLFGLDKASALSNGINKDLIALQLSAFDFLNNRALKGEIIINEDLSIYDPNSFTYLTRNGINRHEVFWWGHRRHASTAEANRISADFNSVATGAAAGAVLGTWFPGLGVGAGLTAAYFALLASRIDSHNSRTNRGVIVDVTWALVFSISTQ